MAKKTNKEITKQNMENISEVLSKVSEMTQETFKEFLNGLTRFYTYSISNQILLAFQGASCVAGFQQWKKKYNRTVKKGSKAIWILAPMLKKVEEDDGSESMRLFGFRSVPVFDIKDTEGEPLKNNSLDHIDLDSDMIEKAVQSFGYSVSYETMRPETGGFINSQKEIHINDLIDMKQRPAVLIHELAHGELGHVDSFDISRRDVKEQEAEITTYLVLKLLGHEPKNSVFYLKSWELEESSIKQSLNRIDKVVKKIYDALSPAQAMA